MTGLGTVGVIGLVVLAFVILVVLWAIGSYNGLVRLKALLMKRGVGLTYNSNAAATLFPTW